MFVVPVYPHEVFKYIMNLKNTTSTGADEIPVKLLKFCAEILCHPLATIVNLSFEAGTFMKELKRTIIKPFLKKGDV